MTVVLKLGGSVITEKHHEATVASNRLERIAHELRDSRGEDLVLILGGGSFGHPPAERHGMTATTGSRDPQAIAEVHRSMLDLVTHVVDRLVAEGIPAVALHPLSMARREGDSLTVHLEPALTALEEGFVPVLHGDGVFTTDHGVTILSGDDLVVEAARELDANRVGLCTSEAGVLDEAGAVVDHIGSFEQVEAVLGESESTDVTGGMARKVAVMIELGRPASIFHLDELGSFLSGGRPGTIIDTSGR